MIYRRSCHRVLTFTEHRQRSESSQSSAHAPPSARGDAPPSARRVPPSPALSHRMNHLASDLSLSPTRTPSTPTRAPRAPQTTPRGTRELSTPRHIVPYCPKRVQRLDGSVYRNDVAITKHIKPDLTRMTLDIQVSHEPTSPQPRKLHVTDTHPMISPGPFTHSIHALDPEP
jgi:hypothetical protein